MKKKKRNKFFEIIPKPLSKAEMKSWCKRTTYMHNCYKCKKQVVGKEMVVELDKEYCFDCFYEVQYNIEIHGGRKLDKKLEVK